MNHMENGSLWNHVMPATDPTDSNRSVAVQKRTDITINISFCYDFDDFLIADIPLPIFLICHFGLIKDTCFYQQMSDFFHNFAVLT